MPTGSKTAQLSLVLTPGSIHPRVLFLHFFDLHFLEERGEYARGAAALAEMRLAVRIAVIVGKRVAVPAASYYETEIARSVLQPFFESDIADRFQLVGSGSSIEEFRWEKADTYRTGSRQHAVYSEPLEQAAGWGRRLKSSTKDIQASWAREAIKETLAERLFGMKPEGMTSTDFARTFADVPERLGRDAFIVPHVMALLPTDEDNIVVKNTLHHAINHHYFDSYVTEFEAAVFQNMIRFGSGNIPSGNPRDDIDFSALVKMCRGKRVIERILDCPINLLDTFCFDNDFVEAFTMSQTDGFAAVPAQAEFQTDLAILTAIPKEREAVEAVFGPSRIKRFPDDPNVYRLIEFEVDGSKKNIVVAVLSDMGNTLSASTATDFLRSCKPKHIWMIGIAGGCPKPSDAVEDIRLGDVVIGRTILESDFGKLLPDGTFEVRDSPQRVSYQLTQFVKQFQSDRTGFDTGWMELRDIGLNEYGLDAAHYPSDVLHDADGEIVERAVDARRGASPSIVHFGGIAAGDTLLKNVAQRDLLRDRFAIKAVEMESAGLRDAGWARACEVGVFRGVVDYCDEHKDDNWHVPGVVSAAAVARFVFEAMVRSEPT
jgi:nucleoside phosphorylase